MVDVAILERADPAAQGPLAGVRARLAEGRRRARIDLLVEGLVWSLAVGLGAAVAALLYARVSGSAGLGGPMEAALVSGGSAFGVAALAAVMRALLFPPSVSALARRADSVFGFDERLSTAMEVEGRAARSGWARTLQAAAIAEAEERAALIDPGRLAPLTVPRFAWVVPAAALLLAVVSFLPHAPGGRATTAGLTNAEPTLAQREETATSLREIAQTIRQETASRPDGYRAAIARTLEAAAESYTAGTVTHGELARQLGQLLDHARRLDSAAGVAPAAAADIPRLIQSALDAHLEQLAQPPTPSADAGGPDPQAADTTPSAGDGNSTMPKTGEVHAMNAGPPQAASATGDPAANLGSTDYDEGVFTPPPNFSEEQYELQQFAGVPFGGADNAGKGEGDAAGRGVMPLAGEALAGVDPFAAREAIALPLESGDSGRRIRIEVEPEAQPSAPALPPSAPGTWRYGTTEAVSRQLLGPEARAIVSRYFGRDADPPAP